MNNNTNGRELAGYKKKSFAMYFSGGQIWFEHLDGLYAHTELVLEKLHSDKSEMCKISGPSLIAINLDETKINQRVVDEVVKSLCGEKYFTRCVFVGVSWAKRFSFRWTVKRFGGRFAYTFINDFEKAKEYLVSEKY